MVMVVVVIVIVVVVGAVLVSPTTFVASVPSGLAHCVSEGRATLYRSVLRPTAPGSSRTSPQPMVIGTPNLRTRSPFHPPTTTFPLTPHA